MESNHTHEYFQPPESFESLQTSFDALKSFCDDNHDYSKRFSRDVCPVDDKSLIELKIMKAIDYADVYTHIVGIQFSVFDHKSYHDSFAHAPRPNEFFRKIGHALNSHHNMAQ